MTERKIIIIGRHDLTDRQKALLRTAFGDYTIVGKIHTVDPNDNSIIEALNKADAVVVQALPIDVLAKLNAKVKTPIYMFKIVPLGVLKTKEAVEVAKKEGADIVNIDPRTGNARVAMTVSLDLVEEVKVVTKPVVTLD